MQNIDSFTGTKTMQWSKDDGIQYLMRFGITRMQASLYLNLMLNGEADARLLAYWTSFPRTEVYRALNELQEKGLVDREIGSPLKFKAVSPALGLQMLIEKKSSEITQMQKGIETFSRQFFQSKLQQKMDKNYQIAVIEGRKRIFAKIKQQHDNAKYAVDILSFLPRFLHISSECMDNYKRATERGVKYRIIIGLPNGTQRIPSDILDSHNNKNTILKSVIGDQRTNSAIFDREQTSLSYYPGRPIIESPLIVTNHPSIVAFAQNSFDQIWDSL